MIDIFTYGETPDEVLFARKSSVTDVRDTVFEIIRDVAENGDRALFAYAKMFDRAELTSLEVTQEEIEEAVSSVDPDFLNVLLEASANIRNFHEKQVRNGFVLSEQNGVAVGQKMTPIERVGLYVPGGTAALPSTVLMTAIPAKLAGCPTIVMITPPQADGNVNPVILAAAKVAGVNRIFKSGGAQAIAALAYGTESIPQVDKIVGPGNAFVAEAKRQVFGRVSIDMIAGPSDILVIADDTCNPSVVAADLLSQAEHDKMASAVLVTTSRPFAERVGEELERQLPLLPRAEIARISLEANGKVIVVKDLPTAIEVSNRIAPEHLEICVDDPFAYLSQVKNAGSVFLGKHCPEALGDYFAGPNHTLPTGGTARFSSPLSVDDFIKKTQFTYYSAEALSTAAEKVACFARQEGLEAHARSALARKGRNDA